MLINQSSPTHPPIHAALSKFFETNDNLATNNLLRRIFFEYLRTKPTLTVEEIEILETVADLLATLCQPPMVTSEGQ